MEVVTPNGNLYSKTTLVFRFRKVYTTKETSLFTTSVESKR